VVPVYVSEITDGSIRGSLGNAVSVAICAGILFVYVIVGISVCSEIMNASKTRLH